MICGLIREPVKFAAYLEGLRRLARPELRVVFSTWSGELAQYPEIAERLAAIGADIVEQDQPDLKLPGHMLHQTMTLELGLSRLDDDVFVLKTRPDICGIMDVHEFLDIVPAMADVGRLGQPFGHRVHVVGMFGALPLYINDIIFAGMAGDLRRMCWLPFIHGVKYPRLAPEQWLWATALQAAANPVLDVYLSVNPGLIFDDPARNAALRSVLQTAPLFARAVAVTAILVRDSLAYFHPDPGCDGIVAECAEHTLDALLWDRMPIAGLDHHPTAMTNTFLSAGLMASVHDGVYRPSPFGDRVQQAMARYGEPGGREALQRDRPMIATEGAALAAGLRDRVDISVGRGPSPWTLAETGAGYAASLETEINHLRRIVEQLQSRL